VLAREFLKEVSDRPAFASVCLFKPAADAPYGFKKLLIVEELLVCFCALDDNLGLAVHRKNCWFARLLQLANHVLSVSLELAEGLDVLEVEVHALNLHEIACSGKALRPSSARCEEAPGAGAGRLGEFFHVSPVLFLGL